MASWMSSTPAQAERHPEGTSDQCRIRAFAFTSAPPRTALHPSCFSGAPGGVWVGVDVDVVEVDRGPDPFEYHGPRLLEMTSEVNLL